MSITILSVSIRVVLNCIIFSHFLCVSLESKLRYGMKVTKWLLVLLTGITLGITIYYLTPGVSEGRNNTLGIVLWILSAMIVLTLIIKGSYLETLFTVLVILNLYVNIIVIAKTISSSILWPVEELVVLEVFSVVLLLLCIPLLWFFFVKIYKKVVDLNISMSFWKFLWMIPMLTYLIYFVKMVSDYWLIGKDTGPKDFAFSVLWFFATYIMYVVTLQMLVHSYTGAVAQEERNQIVYQLQRQEGESKRLLGYIESTARNRHDWRHHLLTIKGFAEKGDAEALQAYIETLIPQYTARQQTSFCENHVANIILQHYAFLAEENHIVMSVKTDIGADMQMRDTDLCVVLGNLLENAVEACMHQDSAERMISVRAGIKGKQLVLKVQNTHQNTIRVKEDVFYSTKHEGKGVGLRSVKRVVDEYQGGMKTEYDENHFTVNIFLHVGNKM